MVDPKKPGYKFPAEKYWLTIARLDALDRRARVEKQSVRSEDIAKVIGVSVNKIPEPPKGRLTDYYVSKITSVDYNTVKNVRRGLPSFAKEARAFVLGLGDTSLTGVSYYDSLKDKRKQLAEARGVLAELSKRALWDLDEKQLIIGLRLGESMTVKIGERFYSKPRVEQDPAMFKKMRQLVNRVLDGEPRLTAAKNLGFPSPIRASEALESAMLKGEKSYEILADSNGEVVLEKVTVSLPAHLCIATPHEYDELQLLRPRKKLRRMKFGWKWRMTVGGPTKVENPGEGLAILMILTIRVERKLAYDKIANEVESQTGFEIGKRIVQSVLEDRDYRTFDAELWDRAHVTSTGYFETALKARDQILQRLEERKEEGTRLSELTEWIRKPATTVANHLEQLEAEGKVFKSPGHWGRWHLTKTGHQYLKTLREENGRALQSVVPEIQA